MSFFERLFGVPDAEAKRAREKEEAAAKSGQPSPPGLKPNFFQRLFQLKKK
jgi:hypothetical protein